MSTTQEHAKSNGVSNHIHSNDSNHTKTLTGKDMDFENGQTKIGLKENGLPDDLGNEKEDLETRLQRTISQTWIVPDGGYGWVVMCCSLMISVIVDGVTYTFGVFLPDLEEAFQEPKSTLTLANSLQVGLYLISGPLVSALTNRFGCRPVIIAGSIIAGLSFVASSFSHNISLLIFTYGVIGGIGFGMMYLPSVVAVSIFFDKKRALATGIAVCGSGIGTFVMAPLTELLLHDYNWRWTLVILGGIVFNGIVCGALIRPLEIRAVERNSKKHDNEDKVYLNGSNASSINSKKNLKQQSPHNGTAVPESVPLITLTDDNQTTLLVNPAPQEKKKDSLDISNAPSHDRDLKFYSSTPNFSSNVYSQPQELIPRRKKADSLSEDMKQRNRSNSIDYTHKVGPSFPRKVEKPSSKYLSHAPMGLAFIGVSDVHINRIRDDVAIPLSRRDINRSMAQMEFGGDEAVSALSVESLPSRVGSVEEDIKKDKGLWACLPESARETLEEMLNFGIFKEKRYWFVIAGNFFCMLGFYVPFVYIPGRAEQLGLSDVKSFLISIIGITNLVGRVVTGITVNYLPIDSLLVTSVALTLCGVMTCICPLCETYASLVVISAIFGLSVAAYISLCSILLCELLGVRNLTNAFGYVILFRGIACIMGPPIAGALIDASGKFDPAFIVGGVMIILGALSHFALFTPCVRRMKTVM